MRLSAGKCRIAALGAAVLLALPLSWGLLTGLFLWTSPFLLLNRVLAGHGLAVLNILALAVLVPALARRRWYCRWMCPAGVLCDRVSRARKSGMSLSRIPELGGALALAGLALAALGAPLLAVLDPVNIFNAFFDSFRPQPAVAIAIKLSGLLLVVGANFVVPHIWCGRLCPLGGLQDLLAWPRQAFRKREKTAPPFMPSRRLILGAAAGLGLGLVFRKDAGAAPGEHIRPPGALPVREFRTTCLRCGSCVRACPTGIIRTSLDPSDIMGVLTPVVEFDDTYCLRECTACGSVCPSGAIGSFSREDKKKLVMGVARIDYEGGCLLAEHRECDLCRRFCEYDALLIRTSESGIGARPVIIEDRCVGCGACLVICPASVISIVPETQRPGQEV